MAYTTMLKFTPFVGSIVLYYTLFIPEHINSLWSTIVKCLPILSLALFTRLDDGFVDKTKINRKITVALLFSCIGDVCLVYHKYYSLGVVAFGVAHIFVIRAAGLQALNLKLGLLVILYASVVLFLITPGVLSEPVLLSAAVFIYSPILLVRVWLACSKLMVRNTRNWTNVYGAIGAVSFLGADSYLSLNRCYAKLPYHQEIVMTTYYIAQAAVALTVLCQPTYKKKKKK